MTEAEIAALIAGAGVSFSALLRLLVKAFELRLSDLREEIQRLRDAHERERSRAEEAEKRAEEAEKRAEEAEKRATSAERELYLVREENAQLAATVALLRNALIGSETEKNEALKELARRRDDEARKAAKGSEERTAPYRVVKD